MRVGGAATLARIRQRPDGLLEAVCDHPDRSLAELQLRFLLATDVDVSGYLRLAREDELLRGSGSIRAGGRALRTATVAHAAIRAAAGQLITSARARQIERALLRRTGTRVGELICPPTAAELRGRLSPALGAACGLSPARAAALARLVRRLDLEALRARPSTEAAARIEREPGFGPWSAGLICTLGIGSLRFGPAGDLGLIRLAGALLGREATVEDTRRLLDRYAPWAALAGQDLLGHPLAHTRGWPRPARDLQVG